MKEVNFHLSNQGKIPKYIKLANSIIQKIEDGELTLDQKLPSVNKMSKDLDFSRETVFKALNFLSEKGIVRSVDKIGYFVNDTATETEYKVFFMMDKFTSFKEDLFNSVLAGLSPKAKVDLFFHHQNIDLFKSLILQNLKNYTHFVIVTYLDPSEDIAEILNQIPANKRIILDKAEFGLEGEYGMIYQDFERDILTLLSKNLEKVNKYDQIIFVNHKTAPHGESVRHGLETFCQKNNLRLIEVEHVGRPLFQRKNLYITIDAYDRDLVEVIKLTRENNFTLGEEIGLISYNDTHVKEVLEGGITVISTDFKLMGTHAADMISNGNMTQEPNSTQVILRKSF